ncbi:1,4-dihydroxy-2-naphthoate polyprenyltransferase [Enterococcus pseudoavium]|uniref:1,4-dihydroxy-2-naphthoate polyprenyltransferase n=1 Tax=Enterococcus pseudoavium TaxID=44007 RepID=A0ABU3FHH0_9ENTE|nr:1,4-dihydroxy-2-naphthoate polyprenyltransferase [Enterococcus pseudoavium]MDT2754480.1 1,4-dihydroxy-2-naphthoate polyprenyltransferase [Enterococcus pseudoavium]MDT2769464.1 1,4-dihydroxy-2-naphthoate polyprenyltransferase [Enterococcus pseudoavium]REC31045.1 1,4-dihydroxy-2-naphthoate polyprenyltransferase [Enterococcus pseudoavium]
MTRKNFFDLVEIRTKLASLFPFLIGVLFTNSYFHSFHLGKTLFFFFGMIAFDMATTAINNYMDFRKAHSEEYKYQENVIGKEQLSERTVVAIIFSLIGFAAVVGIVLALQTGWMLLLMGLACCFIGVFYTFGPIPLSRMPLGEVFSGVTMGLGIFAITIYLNTYDQKLFFMELNLKHFAITGDTTAVLALIWASLPLIATIANIMLANNICDLEQDIANRRYTLPFYLGKTNAVRLFNLLMYSCYGVILIGLLAGIYQWPILIVFLSLVKVYPQTTLFTKEQIKSQTFAMSIKNLVAFNSCYGIGLILTLIWQLIH